MEKALAYVRLSIAEQAREVRIKRTAVEAAHARRNLTQTAFARLARLHRTYLSDLLAGQVSAGLRTRQRLLEVLGGDFDAYFEVEEA